MVGMVSAGEGGMRFQRLELYARRALVAADLVSSESLNVVMVSLAA